MLRCTTVMLGLLGMTATPAFGMGFYCVGRPPTLTSECRQANLVVYGTLEDRQRTADGKLCPDHERSYLEILHVIKSAPILGDQAFLPLGRYIPVNDSENPPKFLIFCDVFKGKIDPYRGVPATSSTAKYVKGALAIDPRDKPAQLRYFFEHLGSSDAVVAADAYQELDDAGYADQHALAKNLSPDELAQLLQNPIMPIHRRCLCALLLGHCGKAEHAKLVRRILDDPKNRESHWKWAPMHQALIGYIVLRPKEGREYLRNLLKPSVEFSQRCTALRALRFLWSERRNVLPKQEIFDAVCRLLDHGDIADMAIEDLLKWKCWNAIDRVTSQDGKPTHKEPIVRRAILRFALSCPGKKAADFVAAARRKDAELVKDMEELLQLESTPATK